jgi:hypothetical protein
VEEEERERKRGRGRKGEEEMKRKRGDKERREREGVEAAAKEAARPRIRVWATYPRLGRVSACLRLGSPAGYLGPVQACPYLPIPGGHVPRIRGPCRRGRVPSQAAAEPLPSPFPGAVLLPQPLPGARLGASAACVSAAQAALAALGRWRRRATGRLGRPWRRACEPDCRLHPQTLFGPGAGTRPDTGTRGPTYPQTRRRCTHAHPAAHVTQQHTRRRTASTDAATAPRVRATSAHTSRCGAQGLVSAK